MDNEETILNYNDIRKMVFLYNALNDGWSVKKIDSEKYELTQDNQNIKKEIILEECLKKFVKYNITSK
jgi:hypothetical protein